MTEFVPKRKFLIAAFLLAMTFCNVVVLPLEEISSLHNGYQDFTIYYMSGLLLRNGRASDLYNPAAQYQAQLRFTHTPKWHGALPYNHPPFEALLFIPFTLVAYWPAYLLWTALNLIMLTAIVIILRRQFHQLTAVPFVLFAMGAAAFFPVAFAIFEGQDVILLLLLFTLAVVSLDRGEDVAAGAFLAGGLFRPHLVVPVVILLAVRRWRVFLGFAPLALALAGISVIITGWHGPIEYLRFVLRVEKTVCAGCFGPQTVPNLRGLFEDLPGLGGSSPWSTVLILASSVVVFGMTVYRIRKGRDSIGFSFSLATLTTLLISFHALVYDLSLLLPMVLFLLVHAIRVEWRKIDLWTILVVCLFLTPLYVLLLFAGNRFFWFALILLGLYVKLILTAPPVATGGTA